MKKRTAVFSFKKRTKYGKNVLVGSSANSKANIVGGTTICKATPSKAANPN